MSAFQSILIDPGKGKNRAQIVLIKEDISKLEQEIDKAKGRLKGQDAEILKRQISLECFLNPCALRKVF